MVTAVMLEDPLVAADRVVTSTCVVSAATDHKYGSTCTTNPTDNCEGDTLTCNSNQRCDCVDDHRPNLATGLCGGFPCFCLSLLLVIT